MHTNITIDTTNSTIIATITATTLSTIIDTTTQRHWVLIFSKFHFILLRTIVFKLNNCHITFVT